ncbi:MAG: Uma2 family endonuclease [Cyanobacteria bacterium P01_A01_bin.105]
MVSQPLDKIRLPGTEELPCSDETPVDNEEQNLLPNLLLFLLKYLWADRMDWFFGVDMAIYHTTGASPRVPVVPDAFLSLGVDRENRKRGSKFRKSYATWEEEDIVPILALEMVSHQYNDEYEGKLALYAKLGVLYYVIYNPEYWQRHGHQPFEVYRLEDGIYRLQIGEPYWMPEVALGLGRTRQMLGGIKHETLRWFDAQGQMYPSPDEALVQERQRAERLANYVRSLGFDPDNLPQ